jgi:uncharacterized protein (TIGR02246 family)
MSPKHFFVAVLFVLTTFVLPWGPVRVTCATMNTKVMDNKKIENAIRAVLNEQVEAWNKGDLDGFMKGYAKSDDTTFVSGDSITRGWQTVLDRYKKSYSSREKMGTLAFSELEIKPLNNDSAVVNGRWQLTRASDTPHGRFTLVFRKTKDGWRIIHDHTSSADS